MFSDRNFMDLHGANIEDNTIHMRHATEGLYDATSRFQDEARRVDAGLESYLQLFEDYTQLQKVMKEAVRFYREGAELGHVDAQFMLGYSYERGDGIEKDKKEAVRWYRLAAEQGHERARQYLALCYRRGMGVEKDLAEATRFGLMSRGHSSVASSWLVSRGCRIREA